MKKVIFLLAIGITLGLNVQAQKKSGYVNSQELLSIMPEAQKADADLKAYIQTLDEQFKTMATEGQTKMKEYEANATTWTDAVKEVKEKELQDLNNRLQEFQGSADEKIGKKREELYKPLLDKAQTAIRAVGTEGSYDYIYDGSALLYAKDSENLLPLVKTKLGIK